MIQEKKLVRATLTGLRTGDGYWNVRTDNATIGKEYRVDPDSIRTCEFYNQEFGQLFKCEVVDCWCDAGKAFFPFPTELLSIEGRPG